MSAYGSDLGGGIGGILYTGGPGEAVFNHYNSRGDVVGQTDGGGSVTWEAAYEGFGERTAEDGIATGRQRANTKDEDATGLLNEGHRYRCLETGVFLTRDPAGFVDGPNVYSYVVQNPWSRFDTDGQFWSAVVTAGFAIYDTYRYATGKTTGKQYAKAMALNAAALVADVATVGNGGGMAVRAANATVRVAKAVDEANTVYETASSVVENGEALGNAISTGDVRGAVRATVSLGVDAAGGKKTGKADVPGGSSAQHTKEAADDAVEAVRTPIHEGTGRAWREGADPNSIYIQRTEDGRTKSVSYYDENGVQFSREDYLQRASHKVTIGGEKVDLKNTPHEHQTRTIEGPNGPYQKNQVRTLDSNGKPTSDWTNERD